MILVCLLTLNWLWFLVGVSKKTEKSRKSEEKKITKKTEPWKKPIKILKKPTGSVL